MNSPRDDADSKRAKGAQQHVGGSRRAQTEDIHASSNTGDQQLRFLRALFGPGDVREIRTFGNNAKPRTRCFDDVTQLAAAVGRWRTRGNFYISLNPLNPELLHSGSASHPQVRNGAATDDDVTSRRWVYVDVDSRRKPDTSATDEELERAREVADSVRSYLAGRAWSEPTVVMSGNGYALLYPVELPNDAATLALIRGVLRRLGELFTNECADVDSSVANASRHCPLPGTVKRKGQPTLERPHRLVQLVSVPNVLVPTGAELLRDLASETRGEPPPKGSQTGHEDATDLIASARHVKLTQIAGAIRRHGHSPTVVHAALAGINARAVAPPLPSEEVARIARDIGRQDPGEPFDHGRFEPARLGAMVEAEATRPEFACESLLHRASVTSIYGPSGEGKTLLAVAIAARAVRSGLRVAYLDEENGPSLIAARLRDAGCTASDVDQSLAYFDFRSFSLADAALLVEALREFRPDIVIFDSTADFYAAAGVDENDNIRVTSWSHAFARPISRDLGAAVVLIEAVAANGTARRSRGASAKRYKADVEWAYSAKPAPSRERATVAELTRMKDRLGYLPATVRFRLGGDGYGRLVFEPLGAPHDGQTRRHDLRDDVLDAHAKRGAVSLETALSRNEVKHHVPRNAAAVLAMVAALEQEGELLQANGSNRSLRTWLRPGRGGASGSGTTAGQNQKSGTR